MNHPKHSYRWVVIVLLFLTLFFASMAMNCIPALFTQITEQIPLSKAQMGTAMGVTMLAALFFSPIGGGLSDKTGVRFAVGLGAFIVAFGGAMRYFAGSPTELIIMMFVLGVGLNIMIPNIPKTLGSWFPPDQLARTNGICVAGMSIGAALAMATAAERISPAFGGWRGSMLAFGACSLVMAILWVLLYRERSDDSAGADRKQNIVENFKTVFKDREVRLITMFYGFVTMGLMSLISLLPVMLEERGLPRAGQLVSIMLGVAVVFNIFGGVLSDKAGRRKPFLIYPSFLSGICVLLFAVFTGAPLIIALVFAGSCFGTVVPVLFTVPLEMERFGTKLAGTVVGVIMMIGNTGGFVGPALAGKLMDITGSVWGGIIFIAAALMIATAFILPVPETGRKRVRKNECSPDGGLIKGHQPL